MQKSVFTLLFLLLVGCAGGQTPIPVDVQFNENAQQDIKGYHPMPVRAFLGTARRDAEITGALCLVKGSGFSANVSTPAAVNVPMYGLRSKALYVECFYDGRKKDMSLAPVNLTEKKVISSGTATGLLGTVVTTAIIATRKNQERDKYVYYDVNMVFKDTRRQKPPTSHSPR